MQAVGLGTGLGPARPAQPCPVSSSQRPVPQLTTSPSLPLVADRASQVATPVARRRPGTQQVQLHRETGRGNVLTMATQGAAGTSTASTGEDQRPLVPLAELESLCHQALGTLGYTPEEAAVLSDVSCCRCSCCYRARQQFSLHSAIIVRRHSGNSVPQLKPAPFAHLLTRRS
jgi:hypothetical protein